MNKKKILWLGDDIRMHSGIATQCREIILGTVQSFDYVQLAGAINHPDVGKIVDMCAATTQVTGVKDAYVKLYCCNNYGDENLLFTVLQIEKPHAICLITDPRFWGWFFVLEKQIRSKIPIVYYNIWDNLNYPVYNKPYYESCDALLSISKQTYNINKWVLGPEKCCTLDGVFDKNGNLIPFENAPSNN
jgi:hypothetical protein